MGRTTYCQGGGGGGGGQLIAKGEGGTIYCQGGEEIAPPLLPLCERIPGCTYVQQYVYIIILEMCSV